MNYPVELKALIAKWADAVIISARNVISWQLIASYRNGQEGLDREQEQKLKEYLLYEGIKKNIVVFQDQNSPVGRHYYATMVIMSTNQLESMLYEAYREGFSKGGCIVTSEFVC